MNGIFNSIFWFISPLPAAFLYNYTLAYLLALKRKKMFSLLISLISFAFSTFCFLCPGLPYRQFLNPIVQYSFLGVCCLLLSKHSLQRRFLAWATIIVVSTLPEPLVFYLCLFLRGEGDPMDYMTLAADPTSTLLIRLTYFILLSIFCFITVQLWDRFIRKAPARVLYYYLLFPLSQAILLVISNIFLESHAQDERASIYCAILAGACVFCVVADYFLFRSMKQLIEKAAIEERAAWSRYLLDQQSIYYAQYLADLDDARKIRQDIHGQLQTAYQLMDQQDETNARTILDGISGQLNHHPVYCPNRIVNSILGVKGSLYRQKNIAFSFDCRLPEPLSLSGVTLCSLFTNVLDNAYHAVQSGVPELRRIDLSAYLVNGFLLLTCQNVESIIKCRRNRYGFSCIIFLSEGRRKEVKTLNGYSYLTLEQRREIERMYAEGERVVDIAARLKRSAAAIYEELKRGYTGEFDGYARPKYSADLAQATVQENFRRRGNRRGANC